MCSDCVLRLRCSGAEFLALSNRFTLEEFARQYFPVVTANCFCTSDGRWLQCLGVDLPRHLPRMARALGIQSRLYPALIGAALCKVLPKRGPRLLKLPPIFEVLNGQFTAAIGSRSWSEVTDLFERYDIWYCPVNTPASVRSFPQALAANMFESVGEEDTEGTRITSPLKFSGTAGTPRGDSTALPPASIYCVTQFD